MARIVVVGGGIAGLAAAWEGVGRGHHVTVLEGDDRLGGKLRTSEVVGLPVDEGADAFITRTPAAVELCREIGLDDLVAPATGKAHLWVGGRLRPIPEGTVLGFPADIDALAAAGVLSEDGIARAAAEPEHSPGPMTHDVTVGELARTHYGDEVADYLVDPLLGGINAGGIDNLSVDVAAAPIAAVARGHASLLHGLAAARAAAPAPGTGPPVFLAPAGGMQRLVDALATALADRGADLRTGATAHGLSRRGRAWCVEAGPDRFEADAVVVATPARHAAALLGPEVPPVGQALAAIPYAGVVLVTLAYPSQAGPPRPEGSGFLVPRPEGRLLTATSWFSDKWAHLDDGRHLIVRASAGRHGDERALGLDDEDLVGAVHAELTAVMGLAAPPVQHRVSRWPEAFPQFAPGHLDRIATVEEAVAASAPGVALAGAYLRGVGIPACIAGGRAAVARVLGA